MDGLFGNDIVVFAQHQFAIARLQRIQQNRGFVGFPDFDLARQIEPFEPDFVLVFILNGQHVHGDVARLEIVQNARHRTFIFHAVADEHDASLSVFRHHRRREHKRFRYVGTIFGYASVDHFKRETHPGRQFHGGIASEHYQARLVLFRVCRSPYSG